MGNKYEICQNSASDDEFCWFIKLNGEQTEYVLDVEGANTTDSLLIVALCVELDINKNDIVKVKRTR